MIFASNNDGKINEVKKILRNNIKSLKDMNINIKIEENGQTYYDNALLKAKAIYEITKDQVIADDSGLEILSLNNYPGINTNRIAKNDLERNKLLISKTKDLEDKRIKAVCTMVYYDGTNTISTNGYLNGFIIDHIIDGNGFGFDSIFRLENGKTISMLSIDEKNKISARRMALQKLKSILESKNLL